jgi:Uncharacterized protein conserved in bacteria
MSKTNNSSREASARARDVWKESPDTIRLFLERRPDYEQLCAEVAYILNKRLADKKIETASITWRAKTLKSFLEKIQRKNYQNPFTDITDFAGVRVVCLYIPDLSKIEEILRDEFRVLEKVDKLNNKEPDEFGYGAVHFIVKLGGKSSGARYDDLNYLTCEVQVRTVLQDAWAIIDHHLVYKQESDVPSQLQRKLNSLAGMFETADDQFQRVRSEREEYLQNVKSSLRSKGEFLGNEVNKDSFAEYVRWKFPSLKPEYYKGQIGSILVSIDRDKYRKLADIDADIEKGKTALEIVNKELKGLKALPFGAVQAALALSLTDEKSRRELMRDEPEIQPVIEANIVR